MRRIFIVLAAAAATLFPAVSCRSSRQSTAVTENVTAETTLANRSRVMAEIRDSFTGSLTFEADSLTLLLPPGSCRGRDYVAVAAGTVKAKGVRIKADGARHTATTVTGETSDTLRSTESRQYRSAEKSERRTQPLMPLLWRYLALAAAMLLIFRRVNRK